MVSWVLLGINQPTDFWVPNQPTVFWVPINPQPPGSSSTHSLLDPHQPTNFWAPINPQPPGSSSTHSLLDPHQPTATWILINPQPPGSPSTHTILEPYPPTAFWVPINPQPPGCIAHLLGSPAMMCGSSHSWIGLSFGHLLGTLGRFIPASCAMSGSSWPVQKCEKLKRSLPTFLFTLTFVRSLSGCCNDR